MSKLGDKILGALGFEVVYDEKPEEKKPSNSSHSPKKPATETQFADNTIKSDESNPQVVLVEPARRGEAREICDELRQGKTVVINVEKLERDDVLRLHDFITGVIYALDGKYQEINENVLVVAPYNVDIKKTDTNNIPFPNDAEEDDYDDYDY